MSPQSNPIASDLLRTPENACKPDSRALSTVTIDRTSGGFRPITLEEHHSEVASLNLVEGTPDSVLLQFETAKNLYFYSYFVYGFYPVSEYQALRTLEFALQDRFASEIPKRYLGRDGRPYLKALLRYAIDIGAVKNEGFARWHEAVDRRAVSRYQAQKSREMEQEGLKSILLDYSEATPTDEDRNVDLVQTLVTYLPDLRNDYAHGSAQLHSRVLGTIRIVSEIINQIYPARGKATGGQPCN